MEYLFAIINKFANSALDYLGKKLRVYGLDDDHICGCPILTSMSAAGDLITFRVRYFVISDIALSKLISWRWSTKTG